MRLDYSKDDFDDTPAWEVARTVLMIKNPVCVVLMSDAAMRAAFNKRHSSIVGAVATVLEVQLLADTSELVSTIKEKVPQDIAIDILVSAARMIVDGTDATDSVGWVCGVIEGADIDTDTWENFALRPLLAGLAAQTLEYIKSSFAVVDPIVE